MERYILSLNPEPMEELFEPSKDDIRDYWCGEGGIIFTVTEHDPEARFCPFGFEIEDYSGCAGGLDETLGITYAINERILDVGKLHLGVTYYVEGITVVFTRGDGWTTDDDADYYVGSVKTKIHLIPFLKAWWWHLVGWRIKEWRSK